MAELGDWEMPGALTLDLHPSCWHRAGDDDYRAHIGKAPGFWPLDKPAGVTSRQLVEALRRRLGVRKAGHSGALDPLATGVLLVAVERALKVLRYAEGWSKEYEGSIRLGIATDTWDTSGRVLLEREPPATSAAELEELLAGMCGYVWQPTPPVSAARYGGERLYELARRGEYHAPKRQVRIDSIRLLAYAPPLVHLRIQCGRGTYVRSIAWLLGEALGCGAALASLRRLREGPFRIEHCLPLDFGHRNKDEG